MGSAVAVRQVKAARGNRTKPKVRLGETLQKVEATAELPGYVPDASRYSSKSRISSKGQLTLPMQVRERLGVGPGDQVEFFFDGERTVVKPVRANEDPFEKWVGIAKDNVPADFDDIAWQREMRGWDQWDEEHYK